MDRRIKYTRKVLNESLLQFLEKKEITKITVTEICAAADVNRSTYYAHFTDPYDQLAKLKTGILEDVAEFCGRINTQEIPDSQKALRVLQTLLNYVAEKRAIFRTLLTRSGDHQLQHEILKLIGEKVFPQEVDPLMSEEERAYLLIYASNGCFGMFYHWLMDENPIPPEQLAKLMADFTAQIRI